MNIFNQKIDHTIYKVKKTGKRVEKTKEENFPKHG